VIDLDKFYRQESGRVRASLVRLLGGFDLAEEALQDAFLAAAQSWPQEGVPSNPRAWLISVGRFKAIDRIRASARLRRTETASLEHSEAEFSTSSDEEELIEDDTLRLIFISCHPVLPQAARIALTLREVCGLRTEEIADAFLLPAPTIAQRIVRAKNKIRENELPFELPPRVEWAERLSAVLAVIYLVFNEGYSTSASSHVLRIDLAEEAIRLGRLLSHLLDDPETYGLLALMLLHHSRRAARVNREGDLIILSEQDRTLWDHAMIAEGDALIKHTLSAGAPGPYTLQALISAVHCRAGHASDTDWQQIVRLYDLLLEKWPSPVVTLNRAVAVGESSGAEVGLQEVDNLMSDRTLAEFHLAHATRAEFLRRLKRYGEASRAYSLALRHARQTPERRFLERRVREVRAADRTRLD
jgi:RNA polymerase sigma-70 factor (ECF subfamily)